MRGYKIKIENTPTTYTSGAIILPWEIILLILGFLRYHVVGRCRCRLVCHQWYHAIRRVNLGRQVVIASEEDATEMARIMTSQENQHLGGIIIFMTVRDNPAKPFAHGLPLRLRGYHFTRLRRLELADLDWTATRPHPLFFRRISYFSRVEDLQLSRCRLHHADDLWNILSALPSLEHLRIDSVTFHLQLFGRHTKPASERLPKLRALDLTTSESFFGDRVKHRRFLPLVLPRITIDVLSLLSTLTTLLLQLGWFSTPHDLERLIRALPALHTITIWEDPSWQFPASSAGPLSSPTDTRTAKAWGSITLDVESSSTALGFLTSFPLAVQPNALSFLRVELCEIPSMELQLAVSQVLEHSGATLHTFHWKSLPKLSVTPLEDPECALWLSVPSLIHNIALEEIFVTVPLPSPLLYFHRTLLALLSSVTSPHLHELWMNFSGHPNHWKEVGDLGLSEEAVDTFHACLFRDVFAGLAKDSVDVRFMSAIDVDFDDAVRAWLVKLFTPWLVRGILEIKLPGCSVITAVPETSPLKRSSS